MMREWRTERGHMTEMICPSQQPAPGPQTRAQNCPSGSSSPSSATVLTSHGAAWLPGQPTDSQE